jgi:PAS domain S-box-containing protein
MPSFIRRTSAIAFAVVALALVAISALAYRTAQRSVEANRWVAHTYEVLQTLERVGTTVVDAENGTRGFALTRIRSQLEPFDRANAQSISAIDTLGTLTADNPIQQHNVAELRNDTAATMQLLQEIVSRAESHAVVPADLSDRERMSMDDVRATLQRMRLEEQRLMAERIQGAASADTSTRVAMIGLIAAAFGVLTVSFLFVDRRAVQLQQTLSNEKQGRQLAELAQQRFGQVMESAPTAMVAVDKHGNVVLVNKLTVPLFGYSRDELIGQSVERLVPPRLRETHARDRAAYVDAPSMRQMGAGRDLYGVRKDGSEVPVEIGLSPIEVDGEVLVLAFIADITERKRAENERGRLLEREQQARAEADAANRSKDYFVARVSHELRTPLNALMGWARMLRDAQVPPDKSRQAMAAIDRNAEVLQTLVEDLVEMSRITTGQLHLERRPLDLVGLVRESLYLLEPAAGEKRVRITTDIERRPIVVDGDAKRLRQIVWNLLSNAIKFTPPEGNVTLGVALSGDEVQIQVVDTGQGIASEFLPHVFEPFSQADPAGHGLGLGLAIVRQLVDAHGGRISVMSPGVGAGATFTVTLPVVRTAETV